LLAVWAPASGQVPERESDPLFHRRQTVFSTRGGEVAVSPIVDRSRKGLAVSIGF
jgi:hypothetical protein